MVRVSSFLRTSLQHVRQVLYRQWLRGFENSWQDTPVAAISYVQKNQIKGCPDEHYKLRPRTILHRSMDTRPNLLVGSRVNRR